MMNPKVSSKGDSDILKENDLSLEEETSECLICRMFGKGNHDCQVIIHIVNFFKILTENKVKKELSILKTDLNTILMKLQNLEEEKSHLQNYIEQMKSQIKIQLDNFHKEQHELFETFENKLRRSMNKANDLYDAVFPTHNIIRIQNAEGIIEELKAMQLTDANYPKSNQNIAFDHPSTYKIDVEITADESSHIAEKVIDILKSEPKKKFFVGANISNVLFLEDNLLLPNHIMLSIKNNLLIYDLTNGNLFKKYYISNEIAHLTFIKQNSKLYFVACEKSVTKVHTVTVWYIKEEKPIYTFQCNPVLLLGNLSRFNDSVLIVGHKFGILKIHDIINGETITQLNTRMKQILMIMPLDRLKQSKLLLTVHQGKRCLAVWDFIKYSQLRSYVTEDNDDIQNVIYLRDGLFATVRKGSKMIELWSVYSQIQMGSMKCETELNGQLTYIPHIDQIVFKKHDAFYYCIFDVVQMKCIKVSQKKQILYENNNIYINECPDSFVVINMKDGFILIK